MKLVLAENPNPSQLIIYQTQDGKTRLEVWLDHETVWLTLNQMADLFQRDKSVISRHIRNVFEEGELPRERTVANFATVQQEGDREVSREIEFFNLDVIISVGYRVKSHRGTQFRIWATQRLREYIVKGFTLDDERLKQVGGGNYFDELLARIRDIRSSEKVFWRKVLDIYATSIDYEPNIEMSQQFFATVQNKMFGVFHDAGYKGLYGGLGNEALKARKKIPAKENLMDRMDTTELAANQFRMTQTRDKLARERVKNQTHAIQTHEQVGKEVRAAIQRIGGTMPENLPPIEHIKEVEKTPEARAGETGVGRQRCQRPRRRQRKECINFLTL